MKGLRVSISDGFFGIGEGPEMVEGEGEPNVRRLAMADRLTPEEALMARINSLERRMEQLENWTGADEEGDWKDEKESVSDQLLVQDKIVRNLLRYLEVIVPGFSVVELRSVIRQIEEMQHEDLAATLSMPASEARFWHERMLRIIDDHLPVSGHDQAPEDPSPKARLSLVPTSPSDDDPSPVEPS